MADISRHATTVMTTKPSVGLKSALLVDNEHDVGADHEETGAYYGPNR